MIQFAETARSPEYAVERSDLRLRLGIAAALVVLIAVVYWRQETRSSSFEDELVRIQRLDVEALQSHTLALATPGGDPDALAAAIERETLPLWSDALRRAEAVRESGVAGLDDLIAYLRARRDASAELAAALRSRDPARLAAAKTAWAEAERLGGPAAEHDGSE